MQITVFGASGHVGRLVVRELLHRGHTVVAVTHRRTVAWADGVQTVAADVHDGASVIRAIRGSDAVISCLGSWGTPAKDILTSLMTALVRKAPPGLRVVSLTGAAALAPGDRPTAIDTINRWLLGRVAGKVLADGEEHIRLLTDSSLTWTVVRSPVMTRRHQRTYHYLKRIAPPWLLISRPAVACCLVDLAEGADHFGQAVTIADGQS